MGELAQLVADNTFLPHCIYIYKITLSIFGRPSSPLHNIVLLMPGAIAVSFCCKAEGHQACGAGDGRLHFAKNTATPPCCARLALRHIHACRNTFGQINTTCGRSWMNQIQWGMDTLHWGLPFGVSVTVKENVQLE